MRTGFNSSFGTRSLRVIGGPAAQAKLAGYSYRKQFPLSRATGAVTNYQMLVTVNRDTGSDSGTNTYVGTKCLDTFADVKFTKSDGITLLDYWIDPDTLTTSLAKIWVECDSIGTGATPFYMYYGKADDTSSSSGANTFQLYSDCSTTTTWAELGGLVTVSSGKIQCDNSGGAQAYGFLRSGSSTDNIMVEAWMYDSQGLTANNSQIGLAMGSALDATPTIGYYLDLSGYDQWVVKGNDGNFTLGTAEAIDMRTARLIGMSKNGNVNQVWNNGVSKCTREYASTANYVGVTSGFNPANTIYVDNFRVRQYLATEPAWGTWGAEEAL